MNLFGRQKSFDGQFLDMLDDLRVSEKERQAMLELPQGRKELLLQAHLKEKRPSFWTRMGTKSKSKEKIFNAEKVNQDFINVITKLNVTPHEMTKLVGYSLEQRYDYLMAQLDRSNSMNSVGSGASDPVESISFPSRTTSLDGAEMNHKWFTEQISNRSNPLKAVYRNLQCLRVLLQNNPTVLQSILETEAGVRGLDIVMDRLSQTYESTKYFADQINNDDIRLEVCTILDLMMEIDSGCSLVLSFPSLIKQLVFSFSLPDEHIQALIKKDKEVRRTRLGLLALVAKLLGPVAYRNSEFTDHLLSLFIELQKLDKEKVVFGNMVSSLVSPVYFQYGIDIDYVIPLEEWNDVWHTRANIMGLMNAMILSSQDQSKRIQTRMLFEGAGLRGVLRVLSFQTPPLEFMVQINEFNQSRSKDSLIKDTSPLDVGY
jgi:hypothetical protein